MRADCWVAKCGIISDDPGGPRASARLTAFDGKDRRSRPEAPIFYPFFGTRILSVAYAAAFATPTRTADRESVFVTSTRSMTATPEATCGSHTFRPSFE